MKTVAPDKLILSDDINNNNMRRANKTSAAGKRSTHLDLPSSHDDGIDDSSKVHKRKSTSKSALFIAIVCGLAAIGTLIYVSDKVFSTNVGSKLVGKGDVPNSAVKKERFLPQQNRLLPPDSIYRTKIEDIHGDYKQLMDFSGKVSLVVNVACE